MQKSAPGNQKRSSFSIYLHLSLWKSFIKYQPILVCFWLQLSHAGDKILKVTGEKL